MTGKSKKILALICSVVAVLFILIFSAYSIWEKAPPIQADPSETMQIEQNPEPTEDPGIPFDTKRQDGIYTLLLVGNDDGNGNTDTIISARFDTKSHKIDCVSIPRDTLINENWNIRKINSVYWSDIYAGGNGIDALRSQVKRLLGFDVDCYAVIDLNVFVDIVDAMGGVYFDVPRKMDYEDPWQNLYIHLEEGYQLLDGYNAMGLCRFRSDYIEGDLGRISMQQEFLKACVSQFMDLGKIPNLPKVLSLLSEKLHTNMTAANFAFFARQLMQCEKDSISFHTAPTQAATIHGYSYAVLELQPWLSMINELLNPYLNSVSAENLDIVYSNGTAFNSTSYLKGADYYMPPQTPKPQIPTPTPKPSKEPAEDFKLPEITMPSPPLSVPQEPLNEELTVPDSVGNIIIDY